MYFCGGYKLVWILWNQPHGPVTSSTLDVAHAETTANELAEKVIFQVVELAAVFRLDGRLR
jgi:hypothetical protein